MIMRQSILNLNPRFFRNSLSVLFTIFAMTMYGQNPPTGDPLQNFCSAAAWQNGGFPTMPGDDLGDLQVHGDNLTWYSDAALTQVITNPDAEILVDGTTYYVTQTVGGVESPALPVNVMELTCACIKEPDFESQDNVGDASDYKFYEQMLDLHKTCGMQLGNAPMVPLGPIDGFDTDVDKAQLVTAGNDTYLAQYGINHPRTNPSNPNSDYGIRVNGDGWSGSGSNDNSNEVTMTKEFVAGEVIVFNYSLVLQNPTSHDYDEQPFFQVRLYDKNDNMIQSRCVVSTTDDCVFLNVADVNPPGATDPSSSGTILFTEWSCFKLNTMGIQGEAARIEFTVGDCTAGGHLGYVYVDDFYVGNNTGSTCNNFNFGYIAIEDINPTGTNNCFVVRPPAAPGACAVQAEASLPFPMEICGTYEVPASSGAPANLTDLTLDILQNGVSVGTISNPTFSGNQFCFTLDETDVNVNPYGDFEIVSSVNFNLNCGSPYDIFIDGSTTLEVCPPAGCPLPMSVCDQSGTGIASFNLTQRAPQIINGWTNGVTLSYYKTENDAYDETNEITNKTGFSNTIPGGQTIYVRTDWDIPGTTDDCFYLVKLQLEVLAMPEFINGDENIVVCGPGNINVTLGAAPSNMADMDLITYEWFKEGVRLPVLGSTYVATEAGTYTVTVSNNLDCSVTKTITVERVDYTLDLGDNNLKICGDSEYTFKPTITDNGSTNPIDDTQIQYNWSTGETTEQITITDSGTYTLETTYKGCVQTKQVTIEIADRPEVSLGGDIIKCASEIVDIQANTSNFDAAALEYTWYRDGGVISGETGSSIQVTEAGTYKVETHEVGAGACVGEDVVEVTFYENEGCAITQGISPDTTPGKNDALDLAFLNDRTGISSIEIFNRHGRSVYQKTGGYTNEWAGQTDDGDDLVTGTYYYVIQLDGVDEVFKKQVLTGWIYVNREIN